VFSPAAQVMLSTGYRTNLPSIFPRSLASAVTVNLEHIVEMHSFLEWFDDPSALLTYITTYACSTQVITYAQMVRLEDLAVSVPERVKIFKKSRVTKLLKDESGSVTGVEYTRNGQTESAYGPVVLATGGYAADFTEDSLLKKYRPELWDLPTTNGDHCTGDGQKLAMAAGASGIDLEKVQVHPTGLVDPKEPEAKVKFLAAEALRGVGGLLLDNTGKRFVDELQHRDFVTGKIWENKKVNSF
jgi:succinate dehydrogenase/fumarate reductase flavoprotein subunit